MVEKSLQQAIELEMECEYHIDDIEMNVTLSNYEDIITLLEGLIEYCEITITAIREEYCGH